MAFADLRSGADDAISLLQQHVFAPFHRPFVVDVATSLTRLLRRADYRILTAQTAAEAFELLALNDVQVIISDQRMPLMNGTEFLAKIKNLYPDTIHILCSGYTELQSLTEAVNRGSIYCFLVKPWDDEEMRQSVREAFHHYWLTHTEAKLKGLRRLA